MSLRGRTTMTSERILVPPHSNSSQCPLSDPFAFPQVQLNIHLCPLQLQLKSLVLVIVSPLHIVASSPFFKHENPPSLQFQKTSRETQWESIVGVQHIVDGVVGNQRELRREEVGT